MVLEVKAHNMDSINCVLEQMRTEIARLISLGAIVHFNVKIIEEKDDNLA